MTQRLILKADQQTIREAATQARKYPGGSYLYMEALTVLLKAYREANGRDPVTPIGIPGGSHLDTLWGWVNSKIG